VILYNTKPDMDGAIPFTSATSRRELITAGQAYSEHDLVLVLGVGRDIIRTVAHELTHLITHQLADNPYRQIPAWLNEGLSMYAEGDLYGEYKRALENAIRQDRLFSVKQMTTMPGRPEDVILLYGQSHSLVKFLIERYGPDKMRNRADSLIYTAERTLREHGDRVPASLRSDVESKIQRVRSLMETEQFWDLQRAVEELEHALSQVGVHLYQATGTTGTGGSDSGGREEGPIEGEFRPGD